MSVKVVAKSLGGDGVPGQREAARPGLRARGLERAGAGSRRRCSCRARRRSTTRWTARTATARSSPASTSRSTSASGTPAPTWPPACPSTLAGNGVAEHHPGRARPTRTSRPTRSRRTRRDFEGMLATSATCGVDATGMLDVTSAEGGTQPVPVTIPTGRAGPADVTTPRPRRSPIPDDNAGGVASNLFVPVSGRIKDLDVRIDSIDHSFVGDLKVELTSPDNATTVRLIEHVGGPNNGGDDLVDTVFDDEAPTVIGAGATAAPYTGSFRPQGDQLVALRRQGAAGHLEAPRERPLRERHRLAARLGADDPHGPVRPERERARHRRSRRRRRRSWDPAHASFEFDSPRPNASSSAASTAATSARAPRRRSSATSPRATTPSRCGHSTNTGNVDGSPADLHLDRRRDSARAAHRARPAASTPHVQGNAGTAPGRRRRRQGRPVLRAAPPSGTPSQSVVATRDGSGSFSARVRPRGRRHLHRGARQSDTAGNIGSSAPVTFAVAGRPRRLTSRSSPRRSRSPTPRPAASRRSASCEGACTRSTALVVSPKTAARLGLPRRSVRLGSGTKRSGAGGVGVKLTRAARSALRRSRGATATVQAVAGRVSLSKAVSLRR